MLIFIHSRIRKWEVVQESTVFSQQIACFFRFHAFKYSFIPIEKQWKMRKGNERNITLLHSVNVHACTGISWYQKPMLIAHSYPHGRQYLQWTMEMCNLYSNRQVEVLVGAQHASAIQSQPHVSNICGSRILCYMWMWLCGCLRSVRHCSKINRKR